MSTATVVCAVLSALFATGNGRRISLSAAGPACDYMCMCMNERWGLYVSISLSVEESWFVAAR